MRERTLGGALSEAGRGPGVMRIGWPGWKEERTTRLFMTLVVVGSLLGTSLPCAKAAVADPRVAKNLYTAQGGNLSFISETNAYLCLAASFGSFSSVELSAAQAH